MKKHSKSGETSQRQLRAGELIRRELASILARGDHHIPELDGQFISIGEVRISPDLKVATIFVYPHDGDKGILKILNDNRGKIRKSVTARIELKYSPELRFVFDPSFDHAQHIQQIVETLAPKNDFNE